MQDISPIIEIHIQCELAQKKIIELKESAQCAETKVAQYVAKYGPLLEVSPKFYYEIFLKFQILFHILICSMIHFL